MNVKCPSCSAVGKVPADKLPERGANIRCPACSYVFFVGGPDQANVVADDAPSVGVTSGVPAPALGAGGGAQVPTARFTGSRPAVPSGDHAAVDDDMPTSDYASAPAARAATPAPSVPSATPTPVTPSPSPTTDPGSARPTTDHGVHVRRSNTSQPSRSRASQVAGRLRKAWKVKNSMGIPLDFVDTGSVREWLGGQGSLDGITASDDGGKTWLPLTDFPELADIEATGLRSRPMSSTRPTARRSFTGLDATEALDAARTTNPDLQGPPGEPPSRVSDSHEATDATGSHQASDASGSRKATDAEPPRDRKKDKKDKKKNKGGKADAFQQEKDRERKRVRMLLGVLAAVAFAYVGYLNLPEVDTGPRIPNTPSGDAFRWVLEQMNGGTDDLDEAEIREKVASYIVDSVTPEGMIENLVYYDNWRPNYEIRQIVTDQPYRIQVEVTTETLDNGIVTVEVENTEPYLIMDIDIRGSHL